MYTTENDMTCFFSKAIIINIHWMFCIVFCLFCRIQNDIEVMSLNGKFFTHSKHTHTRTHTRKYKDVHTATFGHENCRREILWSAYSKYSLKCCAMIGVRFHTRDAELLTHFTYLIAPYILLYQFQHPSYPDKLYCGKKNAFVDILIQKN